MINNPLLPASSPNSETRVRGETNGHADHAERAREEMLQAGVLYTPEGELVVSRTRCDLQLLLTR
jgi:hypothetical protein